MNNKTIMQASGGVLLLALVYFGATYYKGNEVAVVEEAHNMPGMTNEEMVPTMVKEETVPPVTTTVAEEVVAPMYKNGTYTADGEYRSPAGPESVSLSLTIVDDIVTDTSLTVHAENQVSKKLQTAFAAEYKQYVVGKKISDLRLTKVAGASLTPNGFNQALEAIKTQALN
ncbi:MAG: hypothetical protein WAX38_03580 [Minisyncoccia bacterium]